MSVTSVLIAVAALWISAQQFHLSQVEKLHVEFSPWTSEQSATIVSYWTLFTKTGYLRFLWECLLSNNGDRPLSIVEYQLFAKTKKGLYTSAYLDGGLWVNEEEPMELPIHLAPGESSRVLIRLGLWLDDEAYSLLSAHYGEVVPSLQEAVVWLGNFHEIDLFGNHAVVIQSTDGHGYLVLEEKEQKDRVITITFRTGKGNWFGATASWYGQLRTQELWWPTPED